jgi:hypothetical protein
MRDIRPFVSPLAAVVLAAAAVRPAAAQQAAATPARPVIRDAAVTVSPALRTVAIYRFATTSGAGIPAEVTVADSAGRLVASYHLPGARDARPMLAAVIGTERADLVLEAETPSGLLTLQLYGQDDPTAGAVSGRWWLGVQQGALRGRVVR